MRIFVAGGAGYVGSHCVRRLIAAGHEVTVYDNLSTGHRAAVDAQATFVEGDLGDAARLDELFRGRRFDAVMHFAAFLNVGESVAQPLLYWQNNVVNTLTLLRCMQAHGVTRFVFSSTCAVYGELVKLPITEDQPKNPINPYGHTKLAVEWMLGHCAWAWGLGSIALRYFNAAGAAADGAIGEDHDPETHLIPLALQVALGQRANIEIYGTDYPTPDGTCIRDYVHVEDLADAHLVAVEACAPGDAEAYNLGTGSGQSVREIIVAAREVTGHPIPVVEVGRRPGDPPALYADGRRATERFGWTPRYRDVGEIVQTAWSWQRSHPRGFGGCA